MDDYQTSQAHAKPGKRNLWFKDKFVTASDFSLEQGYMIERRRLLTRAVAGWGMVYGMELSLHSAGRSTQLEVSQGLALDRHGRELFLPHKVSRAANELILLGQLQQLAQRAADLPCGQAAQAQAKGQAQEQGQAKDEKKGEYRGLALLCAHYGERELDLVRSNRSCECGDNQYNHLQEVVQFSLAPLHECEGLPWGFDPCGECDCQPPYGSLAVSDWAQYVQQDVQHNVQQDGQKHLQAAVLQTAPHDRGPHDRLAACLAQHYIADEGAALCTVNGIATALHDPLPLAVVAVHINHCGQAEIERIIDANHPRKLLKNNELLFDLVRGCDLTRIGNISWAAWHRQATPIPLHKFIQMFSPRVAAQDDAKPDQQNQAEAQPHLDAQQDAAKEQAQFKDAADKSAQASAKEQQKDAEQKQETPPASSVWGMALDTSFAFEFTGPVQIATLTPEVVQIIVYVPDERSGWLQPWLVPINGLRPHPPHKCDPPGTTRSAVVQVSASWVSDELNNRNSLLRWQTSRVEIHIRGDLILDARGQAVDADALGVRATPSGNGTPGGTFISVFSIAPEGKAEEPR